MLRHNRLFALGSAALLTFGGSARGAPAPVHVTESNSTHAPAASEASKPVLEALARLARRIERFELENGLRVVLDPDRSSPTVAVAVTYGVGSRDEAPHQGGFAHLFEHMMFQGSRHVPRGRHFELVTARGGTLNGTTSADRTNFFEALPASELPLALWLEADRMRWLSVTPEMFENQRAVVQEELRMRVFETPYARGRIRLDQLVYAGYPAYARPTIGSLEDLQRAQFAWVKGFHATHYAPNNAVLSIAGDFTVPEAMDLVRKYFRAAEGRAAPRSPLGDPPEPAAGLEVVPDPNVNTRGILYGFRIPHRRAPAHYALELAAILLAGDESSRLHQILVRDRALAQAVSAGTSGHVGPDDFTITIVLTKGTSAAPVNAVIADALRSLATRPPPQAELERAYRRLENAFAFGIQTNLARATELGEFELFYGDARELALELPRYAEVTPEDVARAVATHLRPELGSRVEVVPAPPREATGKQPASPGAGP